VPTVMPDAPPHRVHHPVKCGRPVLNPAWNGWLRGGSLLFLDSEEKSVPDWNAERWHEFNSQDQMPASRGRGQPCNISGSEVRRCLSTVQTLSTIILSPS
jgi:hypothetical protein